MKEPEEALKLYKALLKIETQNFPKTGIVNVSLEQGVYIIYNQENQVLHFGKTYRAKKGLNQGLQNHLSNQSTFSKKFLKPNSINIRLVGKFKYIEIQNDKFRTFIESLTVGKLCPAHIGTGSKKEPSKF